MYTASSPTILHSCSYVLMVLFITSTCAYVIDSDDSSNSLTEQQIGLNFPSYSDRMIRTTKFPRIGRSPSELDEISSLYDSTIDEDEESNDENEFRWLEERSVLFPRIGKRSVLFPRIGKRSVLFPRIGKRAFHNIIWGNSLSNPHRMLDAQGRYHTNDYDVHAQPNPVPSMVPLRGKREVST